MIFEASRPIALKPTLFVREADGDGVEVGLSIRDSAVTFAVTRQEVKQLRDSLNNWLET